MKHVQEDVISSKSLVYRIVVDLHFLLFCLCLFDHLFKWMSMILGKQHIRSRTVQNGMLKNVFDFICVYIPQNLRVLYRDEPGIVVHFSVLCCVVLYCVISQPRATAQMRIHFVLWWWRAMIPASHGLERYRIGHSSYATALEKVIGCHSKWGPGLVSRQQKNLGFFSPQMKSYIKYQLLNSKCCIDLVQVGIAATSNAS